MHSGAYDDVVCFQEQRLKMMHSTPAAGRCQLDRSKPDAYFHIISKDTGFDPLIKHLRGLKIKVLREKDLAEIPVLKMSSNKSDDEKIAAIVKNLAGRGQSRPRKVKTLANTINSLFTQKLQETELMAIVKTLQQKKYIVVNDGNVSYKLPRQV